MLLFRVAQKLVTANNRAFLENLKSKNFKKLVICVIKNS